jgi:hypothetical protein
MSTASISPSVLRLLEKISRLTIEETQKVEDFTDFLLSKKENELQHSDIVPDNTKETISDFLTSFTPSQSGMPTMQSQQTPESHPSPPNVPETFIERNEMLQESDAKERWSIESNHIIIAPVEPISEKYPADVDFADINASFAEKRKEQKEGKSNKRTRSEDLDWL